jgi:Cof subfamily protein (haloacid dehalogenase superfamily)
MKLLDPKKIKALALDLDGTILGPDSTLSERTVSVIGTCMNRGIQVILCTGRSMEAAESYRAALGAEGPMVYYNGAEVVDMPGAEVLDAVLLAPDILEYCIDLSRKRGVYFQMFLRGTKDDPRDILITETPGERLEMYREHTGLNAISGDLKDALATLGSQGCIKAMFLAESPVLAELKSILEGQFPGRIYLAQSYETFLDIMAGGVSKGRGLETALKYRGLSPAEVIAFGDEENDLPLFKTAGFSAAPANGKEAVRAAADLVVGSNAEDGVAAFLETLIETPTSSSQKG